MEQYSINLNLSDEISEIVGDSEKFSQYADEIGNAIVGVLKEKGITLNFGNLIYSKAFGEGTINYSFQIKG